MEPEDIAPCHVPLRRIPSIELPKRVDSLSDDSFPTDITTPDYTNICEKSITSPLFVPNTTDEISTMDISVPPSQGKNDLAKDFTVTDETHLVDLNGKISNDKNVSIVSVEKDLKVKQPEESGKKPETGKRPGENLIRLAKKSTGQLACKSTGTGIIISKASKFTNDFTTHDQFNRFDLLTL